MRARELLMCLVMLALIMIMTACNDSNSASVTIPYEFDFCGKSVVVVMTKEAGGVHKVHDKATFGDIADQIVEIEDLTYCDVLECVCSEGQTQFLQLTLSKDDKANVLHVVNYLNTLDVVDFAEPNYILSIVKRSSK